MIFVSAEIIYRQQDCIRKIDMDTISSEGLALAVGKNFESSTHVDQDMGYTFSGRLVTFINAYLWKDYRQFPHERTSRKQFHLFWIPCKDCVQRWYGWPYFIYVQSKGSGKTLQFRFEGESFIIFSIALRKESGQTTLISFLCILSNWFMDKPMLAARNRFVFCILWGLGLVIIDLYFVRIRVSYDNSFNVIKFISALPIWKEFLMLQTFYTGEENWTHVSY